MEEAKINIGGMSCQHCVMAVKKAIGTLEGIESAEVSVGSVSVKYDESRIKKEEIESAIEAAGYKINKG